MLKILKTGSLEELQNLSAEMNIKLTRNGLCDEGLQQLSEIDFEIAQRKEDIDSLFYDSDNDYYEDRFFDMMMG